MPSPKLIIPKRPAGYLLIALFFTLCLLVPEGFAQTKADTLLRKAAGSNSDSLKVKLMNDAVWELMFRDKERAAGIAKEAYAIAQKTGNIHSLSDCYNTLGVFHYISSDFSTALDYHKKALDVRTKLKDTLGLMKTYNNLASVIKELGDHKTEVDYYFKALAISRQKKDTLSQARILTNIADAFKRQQQYDRAEEYNLMSLKLRETQGDLPGVIGIYISLGGINHDWKRNEVAENYLKKAGELLNGSDDNYLLAKYHANYGSLLMGMNRMEEAMKHMEQSIACNHKIGNESSNLMNYYNIGNVYHHLRRIDDALAAYQKGYGIALQIGNKLREQQCLLGLSNIYAEQNNYEKAFDCRLKYEAIKDSLQARETNELFAEAEAKYQVAVKEAEIKLLAQKNENAGLQLKQRKYIIITIAALLAMVCVWGYFAWQQQRMKQQRQLAQKMREAEEAERTRIAKDIHDELGSGLTKIKFMSEVAATRHQDDSIKTISGTAAGLVENMRDLIWVMNPANTRLDNLVARIREYSNDYLEEFPIELKIDFPSDVESLSISREAHRNIFMVVKEALQNIVKHAGASEVAMRLRIGADLILVIKDNGKGFDTTSASDGNGLRNMRSRMESIGGQLAVESARGATTVTLQLSMAKLTRV